MGRAKTLHIILDTIPPGFSQASPLAISINTHCLIQSESSLHLCRSTASPCRTYPTTANSSRT